MRRPGFRALSAEAEQRKARDSDCHRVSDKGEGLGCSEREGSRGSGRSGALWRLRCCSGTRSHGRTTEARPAPARSPGMQSSTSSRPAVDEYESHEQQEINVMARDKKCQCDQDESAPHVGHGHDPASLVAVSERAGRQRQHEPRERVRCCDRRPPEAGAGPRREQGGERLRSRSHRRGSIPTKVAQR